MKTTQLALQNLPPHGKQMLRDALVSDINDAIKRMANARGEQDMGRAQGVYEALSSIYQGLG